MPKARANINVYSNTRFSGLIFEDEIYVYHELPGIMWYEIKQKQQKMPKARANVNVYSSTRFSCFSLILSCLTASFSCGIVYLRGNITPESENKQTSVYLIKRKMKKKILYTYPHTGDQALSFEVDCAAPWQRAPPLDHVQVAAVRAAWHES